jgi:protease I
VATIGVLIADMFEDAEFLEPVQAFEESGHELAVIGLEKGSVAAGKKNQTPVRIERSITEASLDDFDALFIPGGYSPDKLRAHDEPVRFVRHFVESGKPVFTICHGPQLLITANVLRRRTITGWKSIAQDITNAGAEFVDAEVVEDGNLITSRGPADLPAFIDACLRKLLSR